MTASISELDRAAEAAGAWLGDLQRRLDWEPGRWSVLCDPRARPIPCTGYMNVLAAGSLFPAWSSVGGSPASTQNSIVPKAESSNRPSTLKSRAPSEAKS
jgi:hypothetical protein